MTRPSGVTPDDSPHAAARVEAARQQWRDAERRLSNLRQDPDRLAVFERVISAISDEIRRKIGQTFTMLELAEAYERAERWTQPLARETAPNTPWAWDLTIVQDAAFARYCRSAKDYTP